LIAHHGTQVTPTPLDADNPAGSSMRAACSDWRFGDADSMSARATESSLEMPDIRLQAQPRVQKIGQSLSLRAESIYERLDPGMFAKPFTALWAKPKTPQPSSGDGSTARIAEISVAVTDPGDQRKQRYASDRHNFARS
jgi:hypothetical protein